jgi:prepilin-type processing-associated H-X9-DG protein
MAQPDLLAVDADDSGRRRQTYICPSDATGSLDAGGRSTYGINGQVFATTTGGAGRQFRLPGDPPGWHLHHHLLYRKAPGIEQSAVYRLLQQLLGQLLAGLGPIISATDCGQPTGVAAMFQTVPTTPYGSPPTLGFNGNRASTTHSGGINVAWGDGSVRFVGTGVNPTTWWSAMTPAAGEVLGSDI